MGTDSYREVIAGDGETHIGVTRGRKLSSVAFRRISPEGFQDVKPRLLVSLTHDERRALIAALEDRDDLEETPTA